jgi:hypothetical protein
VFTFLTVRFYARGPSDPVCHADGILKRVSIALSATNASRIMACYPWRRWAVRLSDYQVAAAGLGDAGRLSRAGQSGVGELGSLPWLRLA